MPVDELLASVESDENAVLIGELSSPEGAAAVLIADSPVMNLISILKATDGATAAAVASRVIQLCSVETDWKYRHSHDEAIGSYLLGLLEADSPYFWLAASRAVRTPRLRFASEIVRLALSRQAGALNDSGTDAYEIAQGEGGVLLATDTDQSDWIVSGSGNLARTVSPVLPATSFFDESETTSVTPPAAADDSDTALVAPL